MNTPNTILLQALVENQDLMDAWERMDVHVFSTGVLGVPYEQVQKILYPHPPYRAFLMAKRSGGFRLIREPRRRLKVLQEKVLAHLYECAGTPKPCAHAFIKDRSIVTNARKHLERRPTFVLNLDLEAFFPSINFYRVRGVLKKPPFNYSHEVATVLAQMCVVGNELPQGAPTSPFLSNQVCRSMDRDLMALAKRHRATYTRYADDITFSFSSPTRAALPSNICTFDSGVVTLGQELVGIINQHTFQINPSKTRMSTRRRRMEVTGIVINEFTNVKRRFIDKIRGALHAWDRYGYAAAQAAWEQRVTNGTTLAYAKRPWKRQTRTGQTPALKNVLWGKLLYVRMVRGDSDAIYTRLAEKYNRLVTRERDGNAEFAASTLPVEAIVRNVDDAERAVFVVEWAADYQPPVPGQPTMVGGQGTAFAYKQRNRLITCDHVFRAEGEYQLGDGPNAQQIPFTTDISEPAVQGLSVTAIDPVSGQQWPLRVVHRHPHRDLALLEFEGAPPDHRHFSGMEAPINRHAPTHLIGFPNWNNGRRANVEPAIVTARFPRTGLQRFEINQLIRKGNSGGPVVDELFRVAGVAQQGAQQDAGNNECLCVLELDAWLAEYDAAVAPVVEMHTAEPAAPAAADAAEAPAAPMAPAEPAG
ncbi:reverse transcriptase domain-containing protein [Burkholderia pseudomallei]|uniref:reverse transcriptase domain-containing protein n=1 Tax=Burkholderia pseudomallei TaxID=28450 RepID=UPI0021F70479|nr:reverse transcriptase domain-containing protein [Burkholderia pseudomallei]MCW0163712.1 reverse transcriptase domain-containing protein [Burkholderia pseudomallei]